MDGHRRSRRRRDIRRCLLSFLAFATVALLIWLLRLGFPVRLVILTTILLMALALMCAPSSPAPELFLPVGVLLTPFFLLLAFLLPLIMSFTVSPRLGYPRRR